MLHHVKLVSVLVGGVLSTAIGTASAFVASALSPASAAAPTSLGEVASAVGIAATIFGFVGWIFTLYIRNMIRDDRDGNARATAGWRDEIREAIAKVESNVVQLREQYNEKTLKMLLEIGEKYAPRADVLAHLAKAEAKADAAHRRLDEGRERLSDHDARIKVLEARDRSGRFSRGAGGVPDGS